MKMRRDFRIGLITENTSNFQNTNYKTHQQTQNTSLNRLDNNQIKINRYNQQN